MAHKTLPSVNYLRARLDYNPETGVLLWKERPRADFCSKRGWRIWNGRYCGKPAGTLGPDAGCLYVGMNYLRYKAHRIAWKLMTGRDPVNEIDHKDCDGTNNRCDNLREATRHQNCLNVDKRWRHSPLPKGVEKLPNGRYRARMQYHRKTMHLGVYDTPEQAHEKFCAFAGDVHGEFFNPGTGVNNGGS